MKKGFPVILCVMLLWSGSSCKKAIENLVEQSLIEQIITNGVWVVTGYQENTTTLTSLFSGYEFKFNSDASVTGTVNGNATKGSWSADKVNYTITSSFPVNTDPLQKLNGTWKIIDSSPTYVKATRNGAPVTTTLELNKK